MERMARIMELFWLVLAFLSAAWAAWVVGTQGWQAGRVFIWFPMVCVAMFFYRRFMRRKMADWAARQHQGEADQQPK